MNKSPPEPTSKVKTAVGEFEQRQQQQKQATETQRATTFVFPSAPQAPSEYAFIDGEAGPPATMPRNGVTISSARSPPPPYVFGRISSHVYDMIDPKSGHEWMFRVALIEFLFASLAVSCAVSCIIRVDLYCPYYTGVWVAVIFLINAVLGVLAAKRAAVNFFVAHLVTSVLAFVCAVILLALSIHNWSEAGFKNGERCVFAKHDFAELAVNWHKRDYPYAQCVFDFKLGLTFNAILMICAVLQGILTLASTIFCFKAVCHCENWRYPRR